MYVERSLQSVRNAEDVYGAPDTLVHRDQPVLHVANLANTPVRIARGQALGTAHAPDAWLDHQRDYSEEQLRQCTAHANMVRQLVHSQLPTQGLITRAHAVDLPLGNATRAIEEDPLAEPPLEGGPKTAETPLDDVPTTDLIREIDVSEELTGRDRERLLQVLSRNSAAFSLDGRLGTVKNATCTIPLREGSKEVSLPPFPGSPAKREVM
ncbi:hypothetical protein C2E23DRAFT_739527, partial [Lenzites betulinus]